MRAVLIGILKKMQAGSIVRRSSRVPFMHIYLIFLMIAAASQNPAVALVKMDKSFMKAIYSSDNDVCFALEKIYTDLSVYPMADIETDFAPRFREAGFYSPKHLNNKEYPFETSEPTSYLTLRSVFYYIDIAGDGTKRIVHLIDEYDTPATYSTTLFILKPGAQWDGGDGLSLKHLGDFYREKPSLNILELIVDFDQYYNSSKYYGIHKYNDGFSIGRGFDSQRLFLYKGKYYVVVRELRSGRILVYKIAPGVKAQDVCHIKPLN